MPIGNSEILPAARLAPAGPSAGPGFGPARAPLAPGGDQPAPSARRAAAACSDLRPSATLPGQAEDLILSMLGLHFGYWGWDLAAGSMVYSPRMREFFGAPAAHSDLESSLDRIHPDDRARTWEALDAHLRRDVPYDIEHRLRGADGEYRWMRSKGRSIRDASGKAVYAAGTLEDISDRKRDEETLARSRAELEGLVIARTSELAAANATLRAQVAERREAEKALDVARTLYHSLVENVPYAIFRKDADGRYTFGNRRYCEALGTDLAGVIGRTDHDFHPPEMARKYREDDRRCMASREVIEMEEEHRLPGQSVQMQIVHTIKCPIFDAEGLVVGVQGVFADVTERRKVAQMMAYQASHDGLTGLPNRERFQDELEKALAEAEAGGAPFAVLMIDLDRFKEINDTIGHHYGDLVLRAIGPRLLNGMRSDDTVARLGGDEFGILLPGVDSEGAIAVARRLLEGLSEPILVDGHSLDVGASIGIAVHPEHGRDRVTLVRHADLAMYAAKRARTGYAIDAVEHATFTPRRLALIAELRQAGNLGQLRLHYQPKVHLATGRPVGAEALIRWEHPREGLMPPGAFLPLAEEVGLIGALDLWAVSAALEQCRAWRAPGLCPTVAVNLSATNLRNPRIAHEVVRKLEEADVPPSALVIEVTEGAIMADPRLAREILGRLHDEGIGIAIDDFGTGYSSLAYLKDLPVDEVKIDQSFVRDMVSQGANACIVRAVIDLGHNLGLRVTAEGVESREAMDLLARLGCDHAQGYHVGRPLAPADFVSWSNHWAPHREAAPSWF